MKLSEEAKQRALEAARTLQARRADKAARPAAVAAPLARRAPRFEDHAKFREIAGFRAFAGAAGLGDPFFRLHDGRSGADARIDGRRVANFGSYDYLGLNGDPRVHAAAKAAIDAYGVSAAASRPTAGEKPIHRALEADLADLYRAEAALIFVSGHATNVSTIAALVGAKDLLVVDQLCHNSIYVGATLSGAARRSFPHNDLDALDALLEDNRGRFENALIVVEGVYSMDGDFPDLARLVEIKDRHGAWLMVDEAHSLGVLGAGGAGLWEEAGVDPTRVDVWMGTLGKTLASCGGFIAGSAALIELLKFNAPGFLYSVGSPPSLTAAAQEALRVMRAEPERVAQIQANGQRLLEGFRRAGVETGVSRGAAVVPAMTGGSLRAVVLAERLLADGVNAVPIVYPAVPENAARVRFFVSSEHPPETLDRTAALVGDLLDDTPEDPAEIVARLAG